MMRAEWERAAVAGAAVLAMLLGGACGGAGQPPQSLADHSDSVSGLGTIPETRKPESSGLAEGSTIMVQLVEVLDSSDYTYPPFVVARIPDDVMGADGKLAFQSGSTALLQVRELGRRGDVSRIDLALYSVTAGGRQVRFVSGAKDLATASFTENASHGPTHRTVHLAENERIPFRLQGPVSLKEAGS